LTVAMALPRLSFISLFDTVVSLNRMAHFSISGR
jgi:hypothetical protein